MTKSTKQPSFPDLRSKAIAAYRVDKEDRAAKSRKTQFAFVKKLVGPEMFGECKYDKQNDKWVITGQEFKCFTDSGQVYAPQKCPAMGHWSVSQYYHFHTLAELGSYFDDETKCFDIPRQTR